MLLAERIGSDNRSVSQCSEVEAVTQDEVSDPLWFSRCELLLLESGSKGRQQFRNAEEDERSPLKAITKQRKGKTMNA
jgi:hypothetical protein